MDTTDSMDDAALDASLDPKADVSLPKSWNRRPDESAKAFRAFECYLALGADRSVTKVARECHSPRGLVGRWSSRFNWPERARAFDEFMSNTRMERLASAKDSLVDEQVALAQQMLKLVRASLVRLMKQKRLSASNTARMFASATRAMQAAFGDGEPLAKESMIGKSLPVRVIRNCPRDFAAEAARGLVH